MRDAQGATGSSPYLVYVIGGGDRPRVIDYSAGQSRDYRLDVWRPSTASLRPPGLPLKYALWTPMRTFGVFQNPRVELLRLFRGSDLVSSLCVVPAWYRWPFMNKEDSQLSSVYTSPECRGRGYATALVRVAVSRTPPSARTWYVTREANESSVAVAHGAGFKFVGRARRTRRLGVRALGVLDLEE